MPSGGVRAGAGRKKVQQPTKLEALQAFQSALGATAKMLRPEEILLRAANSIASPDGTQWTPAALDAAKALLPFSIAKPASVNISLVTRANVREYTDAELEQILNSGASGGGLFAKTQSPLLLADVVHGSAETAGERPHAGETPPVVDC